MLRLDGPQHDRNGVAFWTLSVISAERLAVVLLDREAAEKHRAQLDIALGGETKAIPPVHALSGPLSADIEETKP